MVTLRQDGWRKVFEGLTTPTEVMNQTTKDEEGFSAEDVLSVPAAEMVGASIAAASSAALGPPRSIKQEVLMAKNEYDSRI